MTGNSRSSGRSEPFASILYAEPGALGLMANIISAAVLAVSNIMYGAETKTSLIVAGVHLVLIGGFLQMVAGFLSFRRNDHLTSTAFIVFSSLWTYQGILFMITKESALQDLTKSVLPGLIGFMAISVVLFICSLFVNYIMPPVLAAMLLTLIFEGVGLFYVWGKRVAAAFELFIALTAMYAVVVMTTKGVSQRYVLPGFGNAPIDPLLIKTKSTGKKKHEKKKNTKYAEPMGMGYIGNIVPATLLCFYHLGYFTDFRPASAALLCSFLCNIVASYYAFLRDDFFHSIQFMTYLLFWLSRGSGALLSVIGFSSTSSSLQSYYGSLGIIIILFFVLVSSMCQNVVVFIYNIFILITAVLSLEHIPGTAMNYTFGITSAIIGILSIYVSVSHLLNSIAEKSIVYVGPELVSSERMREIFVKLKHCCRQEISKSRSDTEQTEQKVNRSDTEQTEQKVNRSDTEQTEQKVNIHMVDCLCFISNSVTAISLSPTDYSSSNAALPWLLVAGVVANLYCARLSYAAGSLSRSLTLLVLSGIWSTWSLILFGGIDHQSVKVAAIAALCLHTLTSLMTLTFSKVWMVFALTVEINTTALVARAFDSSPPYMTLVTSIIVGITGLYGSLVGILRGTIESAILPEGEPLIKQKKTDEPYLPCPTLPSRKTEAMYRAAKYLDNGHVIGAPTDTVYGLIASCKHPESISAIYHIKGRPPEKPICLCVSDIDQLKYAEPPFSDLLWTFMHYCYPGGITCVVHKGDWMLRLGVGDALDYVGTKDSVAIRVPDSTALSYLLSIAGPVALTSANPSGEVDSTHHDMVIDRLGHKLAAVVCDDESNELVPSTVVNCTKIDEGIITFFRIGCVPQAVVEELFERAKAQEESKSTKIKLSTFSFNNDK